MPAASNLQALQTIKSNYLQILIVLTQVIATPTQANIDAAILAIDRSGVMRPKVNFGLDGETYDWTGYQTFVLDAIDKINKLTQLEVSPFEIVSRYRP